MKVTYIGGVDSLDIPLSDGTLVTAVRGEPVEIPDEFAARLLEQEDWIEAKAEKAKQPKDGE